MLAMRRWFTIFLLIFLPLQATWAAAGSYCQHETGVAAQHFGHHEHRHQGSQSDEGKAKNSKAVFAVDGDCDFCHPSCGAVLTEVSVVPSLPMTTVVIQLDKQNLLSAILSPPDRPNWQRLV